MRKWICPVAAVAALMVLAAWAEKASAQVVVRVGGGGGVGVWTGRSAYPVYGPAYAPVYSAPVYSTRVVYSAPVYSTPVYAPVYRPSYAYGDPVYPVYSPGYRVYRRVAPVGVSVYAGPDVTYVGVGRGYYGPRVIRRYYR